MSCQAVLEQHYGWSANLAGKILDALGRVGKTVHTVSPVDIKAADEFHMGGAVTARDLLSSMGFTPADRALDVGCGIGGVVRQIACDFPVASVDGVDLTAEFVAAGNEINSWPGICSHFKCGGGGAGGKIELKHGSGIALPYADQSFDKITMLHVGMNVQDKQRLFSEFARVLSPGGRVGIFDIMRLREGGELDFPMPWSSVPETSFVDTPDTYKACAERAGFALEGERNRREEVLELLAKQLAAGTGGGDQPALNVGILMGPTVKEKGPNVSKATREGLIGPVELIFRAAGSDAAVPSMM